MIAETGRPPIEDLDVLVDGDNDGLSRTMSLLSNRVPLGRWDLALRRALAGAVLYRGPNRREAAKAGRLLLHLFGDGPSPLAGDGAEDGRFADRLRADLADLVPFGAGMLLVADDEVRDRPGIRPAGR